MASDAIVTFANKGSAHSFLAHDGPDIFFYVPLLILLLVLAFFASHRGGKWFRKAERALARLAPRRALTIFAVGSVSLIIVVSATIIAGVPVPKVDDEFSYLLAADTFAHGRLTNPTHPLWMHFETFHTIQQPTYASKYPPGQGLILALGQVLGHPVVGVWLSTALACAAICWMLMGWFPARWAIVGALLAVVHPEILAWSQRYWGGSLTLAGGALAIGAFRRVLNGDDHNGPRIGDAALMALGMAVLIICRPYEGGVMTLLLLAALAVETITRKKGAMCVRVGSPVAAGLAVTVAWMCYYNWRVTHDPFRMPQQVYAATYNGAPAFFWQNRPPTPEYHHKQMRDFHLGWEMKPYTKQRTAGGLLAGLLERTVKLVRDNFRLWPLLIAFAAFPWALRNRWMKIALLIWALFTIAMLQVIWTHFHYAAPAFGLFFVLAVQSLRHLRLWQWRDKPVGLFLARGCLILSTFSLPHTFWRTSQLNNPRFARRNQIVTRLEHEGGKHLIIVRYASNLPNAVEWVYNGADIDRAPVIWAREMDPAQNRKLLDYFEDRRVWLLQVDPGKTQLLPYSPMADPGFSVLYLQKNIALANWFCAH